MCFSEVQLNPALVAYYRKSANTLFLVSVSFLFILAPVITSQINLLHHVIAHGSAVMVTQTKADRFLLTFEHVDPAIPETNLDFAGKWAKIFPHFLVICISYLFTM